MNDKKFKEIKITLVGVTVTEDKLLKILRIVYEG